VPWAARRIRAPRDSPPPPAGGSIAGLADKAAGPGLPPSLRPSSVAAGGQPETAPATGWSPGDAAKGKDEPTPDPPAGGEGEEPAPAQRAGGRAGRAPPIPPPEARRPPAVTPSGKAPAGDQGGQASGAPAPSTGEAGPQAAAFGPEPSDAASPHPGPEDQAAGLESGARAGVQVSAPIQLVAAAGGLAADVAPVSADISSPLPVFAPPVAGNAPRETHVDLEPPLQSVPIAFKTGPAPAAPEARDRSASVPPYSSPGGAETDLPARLEPADLPPESPSVPAGRKARTNVEPSFESAGSDVAPWTRAFAGRAEKTGPAEFAPARARPIAPPDRLRPFPPVVGPPGHVVQREASPGSGRAADLPPATQLAKEGQGERPAPAGRSSGADDVLFAGDRPETGRAAAAGARGTGWAGSSAVAVPALETVAVQAAPGSAVAAQAEILPEDAPAVPPVPSGAILAEESGTVICAPVDRTGPAGLAGVGSEAGARSAPQEQKLPAISFEILEPAIQPQEARPGADERVVARHAMVETELEIEPSEQAFGLPAHATGQETGISAPRIDTGAKPGPAAAPIESAGLPAPERGVPAAEQPSAIQLRRKAPGRTGEPASEAEGARQARSETSESVAADRPDPGEAMPLPRDAPATSGAADPSAGSLGLAVREDGVEAIAQSSAASRPVAAGGTGLPPSPAAETWADNRTRPQARSEISGPPVPSSVRRVEEGPAPGEEPAAPAAPVAEVQPVLKLPEARGGGGSSGPTDAPAKAEIGVIREVFSEIGVPRREGGAQKVGESAVPAPAVPEAPPAPVQMHSSRGRSPRAVARLAEVGSTSDAAAAGLAEVEGISAAATPAKACESAPMAPWPATAPDTDQSRSTADLSSENSPVRDAVVATPSAATATTAATSARFPSSLVASFRAAGERATRPEGARTGGDVSAEPPIEGESVTPVSGEPATAPLVAANENAASFVAVEVAPPAPLSAPHVVQRKSANGLGEGAATPDMSPSPARFTQSAEAVGSAGRGEPAAPDSAGLATALSFRPGPEAAAAQRASNALAALALPAEVRETRLAIPAEVALAVPSGESPHRPSQARSTGAGLAEPEAARAEGAPAIRARTAESAGPAVREIVSRPGNHDAAATRWTPRAPSVQRAASPSRPPGRPLAPAYDAPSSRVADRGASRSDGAATAFVERPVRRDGEARPASALECARPAPPPRGTARALPEPAAGAPHAPASGARDRAIRPPSAAPARRTRDRILAAPRPIDSGMPAPAAPASERFASSAAPASGPGEARRPRPGAAARDSGPAPSLAAEARGSAAEAASRPSPGRAERDGAANWPARRAEGQTSEAAPPTARGARTDSISAEAKILGETHRPMRRNPLRAAEGPRQSGKGPLRIGMPLAAQAVAFAAVEAVGVPVPSSPRSASVPGTAPSDVNSSGPAARTPLPGPPASAAPPSRRAMLSIGAEPPVPAAPMGAPPSKRSAAQSRAAAVASYLDSNMPAAPGARPPRVRRAEPPGAARPQRDQPAPEPAVRVHIGRIRVEGPPAKPGARFSRPSPSLRLADYIDRRRGR
jgi:hypothetical protein